jgi:iron complex transport system ATP-binding protein
MIELENLLVTKNERRILSKLSFMLPSSGIYGLLGPNGAGKTTLLRVLAGVQALEKGSIRIQGQDLEQLSVKERSQLVSYIPQIHHINFGYTVREVVSMGRHPYNYIGSDIVDQAIRQAHLWDLQSRSILELSGGERQRVFLARAFAQESSLLLMDEPFTFLDLKQQLNSFQLIQDYAASGKTVLITLHDPYLAQKLCHQVLLLNEGCILHQGSPDKFLQENYLRELYNIC